MGKMRIYADHRATGSSIPDLGLLAKNEPDAFLTKAAELIESGKLSFRNIGNLKDLYDVLAPLPVKAEYNDGHQVRAIQASAFPLLTGSLIVAQVNEGYDAVSSIGGELCTDIDSNKKVEHIAAITSEDTAVDRVKETEDFPEVTAGQMAYAIMNKRNGRRLSISKEAIEENNIADIVRRANAIGEIAAELIEEQTLRRVCDIDGSATSAAEPYVMHRNNAGASLYSATANTPSVQTPLGTRITNNALVDATNLEAARSRLAGMLNTRLKRIAIPMSRCTVLVPDALIGVLNTIMASQFTPGVYNEVSQWGPQGMWRPKALSSPKLDDLSTTAWYMGDFKRQFVRKWKIKLEYVQLESDPGLYLRSRIAFQCRLAWDVEIGVVDHVYVVQNLTGTTAP
jgi:hypothetical protein